MDEQIRWQLIQGLFHRSRELAPKDRDAFLRIHCGSDERLLAEVTELLDESPSVDAQGDETPRAPREDLSGSRFGHYELVRIIGEGAMGVIYEARQRYVRRSVALKILRKESDVLAGGGSPEIFERMAARFREEAEVLGRLDHPGIVPIHEMERDESGRSYFTMRLVEGEDLRGIIDRVHRSAQGWTLQRALGVVLRVCETMAFAHDRGVLHRDLKPSHVMVGRFGEVYIVDWGLAKVLGRAEPRDIRIREHASARSLGGNTAPLLTIEGDVLGTPAYMPPEQAFGRLEKIGTRSDVYAVGALLHHLLSGQVPHLRPGERGLSQQEILQRVKSGPPLPLHTLNPHVAPALAAICDKAMAREIEARYVGMEALAEDLRAFLENRVVSAHRTGPAAQLLKWLQRNRALAAASLLILLVGAGWGISVLSLQARASRRLMRSNVELAKASESARVQRDEAQRQASLAKAVNEFLDGMLRSVDPSRAQGEDVSVRAVLDEAAQRLECLPAQEPQVEAAVRTSVGVTYRHLGRYDEAERHLEKALSIRRELLGDAHPDSILSLEEYAILMRERGRLDRAEELLSRSLELHRSVFGGDARVTLRSMGNLAQTMLDQERLDEAERTARALLAAQERALGPQDEDTLVAIEILGGVHYRRGELDRAEDLFRRQLAVNRAIFGDEHSNTMLAETNLVSILDARGRCEEACSLGEDLLARTREVFGARHRNSLLAAANLAVALCNQGREDDGLELLRETIAVEREVLGPDHPETLLSIHNLAALCRRAHCLEEAATLYRELLERGWASPQGDPETLRNTLRGLADVLIGSGDCAGALEPLERVHELQTRDLGPDHADTLDTLKHIETCKRELEHKGR